MLTVLEFLMIAANLPVLVWALLPVRRVPRLLDFLPSASVFFMVLHLFLDGEAARFRFFPLYIFTIAVFLVAVPRLFRHNPNQPKRRILAAAGRLAVLLALTGSVLVPTVLLPFHTLPAPTGDFSVGTVTCALTDKNRIEAFSKEAGKNRELAVQFWYPADKTGSAPESDLDGAPVSSALQSYPVLIFSHGAFGVRMSNASAFRELASHGYIVASIDHTYHSFFTSFPDGRKVPIDLKFLNEAAGVQSDKIPADESFDITHAWLKLRTADIEFVMDSLQSGDLGAEGQRFVGRMDLEKIGLFGHSLGGAAAAEVCRERDDVAAAVVLDGTMIGDITGLDGERKDQITKESFPKPLMLMYGSLYDDPKAKESSYLPNIEAFKNAKDAVYSLCIKDSGHLNFTDLPRISPFLSGLLGVGTVDSYSCIDTVNAYTLAFFDRHIKGKPSSLLDESAVPDGLEFEKRIPAVS